MDYQKEEFGQTKNGKKTFLYTLSNEKGMKVKVTDFGANVVSIIVKDKEGKERDVVLGYDAASGYEEGDVFFGACVGRNANRIGGAKFSLNNKVYELAKNDGGKNNLHSGPNCFHARMWEVEKVDGHSITFFIHSEDMEQGYPGNADIHVTYEVTEDNAFRITYQGVADADTIFNMTNHSYFNLNGHDSGLALNQKVWLNADKYTEANADSVPTGRVLEVAGTPMDFTEEKELGRDIEADYPDLRFGAGYDRSFVINGEGYRKAGSLYAEESGIFMEVYTDCPAVQLYTANYVIDEKGKNGAGYDRRHAVCFETQFSPDAVNHENFKSPVCKKGEKYQSRTEYVFGVRG